MASTALVYYSINIRQVPSKGKELLLNWLAELTPPQRESSAASIGSAHIFSANGSFFDWN
jgi:hypothetical protein